MKLTRIGAIHLLMSSILACQLQAASERLFAVPADSSGQIVELNPSTGTEMRRLATPAPSQPADGLAFNGTSLFFITGDRTLYEIDPDTGAVVDSDAISVVSGGFDGLGVLGTKVYILDHLNGDIIVFDAETDTVMETLDINGVNSGLDIIGGLSAIMGPDALIATVAAGSAVVEINPATGLVTRSFSPASGRGVLGVAVINGEIYLGRDSGGIIDVYSRTGVFHRSIGPLPYSFSALGGDDVGGGQTGEIWGTKWNDLNRNGVRDAGEPGMPGWTIFLDQNNNGVLDVGTTLEPDDYADETVLNNVLPGVAVSTLGGTTNAVYSRTYAPHASTGVRLFCHNPGDWWDDTYRLRMDFNPPASFVSIDFVSFENGGSGRLDAYDVNGTLLGSYVTGTLAENGMERMTISRPSADIAYALTGGNAGGMGALDHLVFGNGGSEVSVVTSADGNYAFTGLAPGTYTVAEVLRPQWTRTYPAGSYHVTLTAGQVIAGIDFGNHSNGFYRITDVGGGFAEATGVNNSLQVTGTLGGGSSSFLWQHDVMTNLGTFGRDYSIAYDINDSGQVVGMCWYFGGLQGAFIWTDSNGSGTAEPGEWIDIGTFPGSTLDYASAFAVNSFGQVAGEGVLEYGRVHAFVWSDQNGNGQSDPGEKMDLGTLGGNFSLATDINDAGVTVGYSQISQDGPYHGFLWSDRNGNGQFDVEERVDIGAFEGFSGSFAIAAGNDGTVAGYVSNPGGEQPFLWKDTNNDWQVDPDEVTFLATLGGRACRPAAVNRHGAVVGWSETGRNSDQGMPVSHGWLYAGGVLHDLNDLIPAGSGWTIENASDINDSGAIVGFGTAPDGQRHAFLLTNRMDLDFDGDVGLGDFAAFEACASGPAVAYTGDCGTADFDNDGDVDSDDFAVFQRCLSNEDDPVDPNCAN